MACFKAKAICDHSDFHKWKDVIHIVIHMNIQNTLVTHTQDNVSCATYLVPLAKTMSEFAVWHKDCYVWIDPIQFCV